MKKIISPILYALCIIPLLFLEGFFVMSIETTASNYVYLSIGGASTIPLGILAGIVLCGGASYFLLRFEGTKNPTTKDHLRHSSIMYFIFYVLLTSYMLSDINDESGLSAIFGILVFSVLIFGIVVNALTLFIVVKKHDSNKQ